MDISNLPAADTTILGNSHKNTGRNVKLGLVAVAIPLVLVAGLVVFIKSQQQNTENRSHAAKSNVAIVNVETKPEPSNARTIFTISSDANGLDPNVKLHTIEADITINIPQESTSSAKVLGTNTDSSTDRSYAHVKVNPASLVTHKVTTTICLTDVVEDSTTKNLHWKTTNQELSGAEKTLYDGWVSMGKVPSAACQTIDAEQLKAPAPAYVATHIFEPKNKPQPSKTPSATVIPTSAATPVPVRVLYNTKPIQISTTVDGLIFETPTIVVNPDKSIHIHLKASAPTEAVSAILSGKIELATIQIDNPQNNPFVASLTKISVKGVRPELPGIEVELTTPATTPTPVASASATPVVATQSAEAK